MKLGRVSLDWMSSGRLFHFEIAWGKKENKYALVLQIGLLNCIEPAFLRPEGRVRLTSGALAKVKLPLISW